jgi:hypothetical protein
MNRIFVVLLVGLFLAVPARSQTQVAPGTVDGSKSPELIPDNVAYRLVFVSLAIPPNATAAQQRRQGAFLARIGLNESDSLVLLTKLSSFYTRYADFRKHENDAADQARGTGVPIDGTWVRLSIQRRDALVQSVRDELRTVLSPNGMNLLDTFVQKEKRGMTIASVPSM